MSIQSIHANSSSLSSVLQALREAQDEEEQAEICKEEAAKTVSANDADGDGLLSAEETGLKEETIAALDSDGDGLLSEEELAEGLAEQAKALIDLVNPAARYARSILSQLDADEDGVLSLAESGLDRAAFSKVDADGDGSLSIDEIKETVSPSEPEESGQGLTQAASGLPASTFNEIDTDGDGVISQAELQAWLSNSQTSLADILSEEDASGSSGNDAFTGLYAHALGAYQTQVNSIMHNLFDTKAGLQAMLNAAADGKPLDLDV